MFRTVWLQVLAVLIFCLCFAAADQRPARVFRRQDTTNAPSLTASLSRTRTAQLSTTIINGPVRSEASGKGNDDKSQSTTGTPSINTSNNSNSTTTSSLSSSSSKTNPTILATPSNINGAAETSSFRQGNYNITATPNTLPITPQVTPGFAVGGVILILTGAVYTFIGIKNKWLHTFLSAAYLSGVSVTVLILYVMELPVSNAVQGAYLVAIVMTGIVLGGASIIFTEMTEGLGCLLGGFCFSMWLLVLKPGGLIDSTSGKVIFIAVFTIAAFTAAFSRYTRDYGLIVGISFAGATAVVLGVDCFSRAGLKEFWAYIWDLNTNIFPVGATSYPVTRGMKVEIAAVVILSLTGIISQLKLWKIIKQRRTQRALTKSQHQRDLDREEVSIGRRIENRMAREKYRWEAVYGEHDDTNTEQHSPSRDSGVGDMDSQHKGTRGASVPRSDEYPIEMAPMPSPAVKTGAGLVTAKQEGKQVVVRVAGDIQQVDGNLSKRASHLSNGNAQVESSEVVEVNAGNSSQVERKLSLISSKRNSNHSRLEAPKVVPLPFKIPDEEVGGDDDASSVATIAEEEGDAMPRSKRLSSSSALLRRLSKRSHRSSRTFSRVGGESSEDLVIPRVIEDDRASSIAATLDGLSEDEDMRSVKSSVNQIHETEENPTLGNSKHTEGKDPDEATTVTASTINLVLKVPEGNKARPLSDATEGVRMLDPEPAAKHSNETPVMLSLTSSTDPKTFDSPTTEAALQASVNRDEEAPTVISAVGSRASITKDKLPQLSKVVMKYRTNEWAKHLDTADNPELDELQLEEYPTEAKSKAKEIAAPVDVQALQETTASVSSIPRPVSQMSNRAMPTTSASAQSKIYPTRLQTRSASAIGQYPPQPGGLSRNTSQHSLSRNIGLRSSSTQSLPRPIVESTIEGEYADSQQHPNTYNNSSGNLWLGKTDSITRAKQSYYGNGAALASTPEFPHGSGSSSETELVYNYSTPAPVDDDNISLSTRQNLIRQSSVQYPSPVHRGAAHSESHQPKLQSSTTTLTARELQLASWRASVAQDLQSSVGPRNTMERSRSALFHERQTEEQRRAMEAHIKAQRESALDARMRNGDMLQAHRDALRKMQAKANRSAT